MTKRFVMLGATMVALAVPALATAQGADTRNTLAVLPFTNGSIHPDLAPLTKGFQALLLHHMAASGRVRVVERDQIQRILDEQKLGASGQLDAQTLVRVGRILGAKYMIYGTFITDPSKTMTVTVQAFDSETSEYVYTDNSVKGKVDDLLTLIDKAGALAATNLKLPALPAGSPAAREASTNVEKLKKMPAQTAMLYARAIEAQDSGKTGDARVLYRQVLDKMPDFEPAKKALDKLQ